jgi:ribonuclease HI
MSLDGMDALPWSYGRRTEVDVLSILTINCSGCVGCADTVICSIYSDINAQRKKDGRRKGMSHHHIVEWLCHTSFSDCAMLPKFSIVSVVEIPMNPSTPHYLLLSEANRNDGLGHWRFVLRAADDSTCFEAADVEPDIWGERLDLLTVVRALESLDQPSLVTLIKCSRYVEQGIQFGMAEWRESGWRWEAFGQMVPVRDADLWQRMDRILQFHQVECGQRQLDGEHPTLAGPHWDWVQKSKDFADRVGENNWIRYTAPVLAVLSVFWVNMASRFLHQMSGIGALILLHRS